MDGNYVIFELFITGGRPFPGYFTGKECFFMHNLLCSGSISALVRDKRSTEMVTYIMCIYLSCRNWNSFPSGRVENVHGRYSDGIKWGTMCL